MTIITTTKQMRPRDANDFYPTPLKTCLRAIALLPNDFVPTTILDPGAGTGVWGEAAGEFYPHAAITGVEIRLDARVPAAYNYWYHDDFRLWTPPDEDFDLIIGNPPYKYAEAFIRFGMDVLRPDGTMCFLLRLAFLEGQNRGKELWRRLPPYMVAVCSERPSFTGDGHTDATAYAMFYWRKGWTGETRLTWLK
jgi:hypothetical protein